MLSSITPLGERGRNNRWWLTAAAYAIGSTLGGATIGVLCGTVGLVLVSVLGGVGSIDPALALGLLAVVALLGLAGDLGLGGVRIPTPRRQVNEDWIGRYRGWVYGLGYGYQLGLGVVTIVTSAITWVALAAAVLTGSVTGGLAIGATFGLVRAVPLLFAARVHHPGTLRALHRRNQRWAVTAGRLAVGAQAVVVAISGGIAIATLGAAA